MSEEMIKIEKLFDMLDDWRQLPDYQLERRADIFFAIHLAEILKKCLPDHVCAGDELYVIPEFPLNKSILGLSEDNLSVKVDYFIWNKHTREKPLLVELKTDMKSRKNKQDNYLDKAADTTLNDLLEGIKALFLNSDEYRKYFILLCKLKQLGLMEFDADKLKDLIDTKRKLGWTEIVKKIIEIPDIKIKPTIIYIQPKNDTGAKNVIAFSEIIEKLDQHDNLTKRFCESLCKWIN